MDSFKVLTTLCFLIYLGSCSNNRDQNLLETVMNLENPIIETIKSDLDKFEFQASLTVVTKYNKEKKEFTRHTYNLDTTTYFYPASTVKMPVAFLALQRLEEIQIKHPEINRNTAMIFDSLRTPQSSMITDPCSPNEKPTIASLIDQVFATSDNNAYNRLYEFLGQQYINNELQKKGLFSNSRIITRVGISGFDRIENTYVPSIHFVSDSGEKLLTIDERKSIYSLNPLHKINGEHKGVGYINSEDSIVNSPFDMSQKNFINISDLEKTLITTIYPDLFSSENTITISDENRNFLMTTMEKLPKDFPCYASNDDYYDSYVKFFMYGDSKEDIPEYIVIKNKVGFAYGTLTDVAHIKDLKNNLEFFLTATIHVNENQVFNDGIYEYDSIGIPFLAELGRETYKLLVQKNQSPD